MIGMKVPGLGRVRRASQATWSFMSPHGAILMYHRVASADHDPWSLCVSPDHFAEQLDVLGRHADVVPLRRLFDAIPLSGRSRPPVAITFADRYTHPLHAAKPILDCHDMPATLFVASGYTGSDRPFWSDELVRIVLDAPALPAHLALTIDGVPFERDIARDAADEGACGGRLEDRPWPRRRRRCPLRSRSRPGRPWSGTSRASPPSSTTR